MLRLHSSQAKLAHFSLALRSLSSTPFTSHIIIFRENHDCKKNGRFLLWIENLEWKDLLRLRSATDLIIECSDGLDLSKYRNDLKRFNSCHLFPTLPHHPESIVHHERYAYTGVVN